MPYFILGVSLFVAVLLLAQWFVNANPTQVVKFLRYSVASVLGLIAIFLLFNGRIGAAIPLGIGMLMALGKWPGRGFGMGLPNFGGMFSRGGGRPSSGKTSEAATEWLRMQLDHDSGDMSGEVLKGRFAGQQLSALSLAELAELLGACHGEDEQSATLLATYLERAHGPDWQEQAYASSGGGDAAGTASAMTIDEARDILGVGPDAGGDQIREAHRAMMKKLHPDQGGSTYLARAINAAKDLLLKK